MDAKSKSKIIIVGGAGFVGNAIYTKCVKMGEDCVSITRSDIDSLCKNSKYSTGKKLSCISRCVVMIP